MAEVDHDARGAAIAKLCDFNRYELLSADELDALHGHALFVWANHQFLLESGTPSEVARTISRAMFRVHDVIFDDVLISPPPSFEMIGVPAAAPVRALGSGAGLREAAAHEHARATSRQHGHDRDRGRGARDRDRDRRDNRDRRGRRCRPRHRGDWSNPGSTRG